MPNDETQNHDETRPKGDQGQGVTDKRNTGVGDKADRTRGGDGAHLKHQTRTRKMAANHNTQEPEIAPKAPRQNTGHKNSRINNHAQRVSESN